jgi:hypothetical protein
VKVESLYPAEFGPEHMTVDEFMAALPKLDKGVKAKISIAASKGEVLRYAAVVENGACSVGLVRTRSPGDAKSSLGDAKSSLGDAKSSLDEIKSSLGDAKSSPDEIKTRWVRLTARWVRLRARWMRLRLAG